MKKRLFCKMLLLFLFVFIVFNINCYASSSDFTYELDSNNYATITSYKGSNSNITIPSKIDGYEVKKIANHAFDENRNSTNGKILTNVKISEGITTIGDFAFVDCNNLQSIILPNTLTSLGDQTFIGCIKLNTINIPSNLKQFRTFVFQETGFTEFIIPKHFESIGSSVFRACSQLKSFKVYSKDVVYDDRVFEHCSNNLILYGYEGSTTQSYAEQNGLQFKVLSDNDENIPITSITLNKTSLSLYVEDTETLSATILPNNAIDKTVIWSSNNSNIATVENGKVIAKSIGSTIITVSTPDGTKKATCNVKVIKRDSDSKKLVNNTVVDGKLPQTGVSNFLLILLALLFIVILVSYKYCKNLKKI